MSGFLRGIQPRTCNRAEITAAVTSFIAVEIAQANAERDPFGIGHDCLDPSGHDFTAACGEVVCIHCGRIAWG